MKTGYRQRAERFSGQHEVAHTMVCTGSVAWETGKSENANPFVIPPLQIERTTSKQILAGLLLGLEKHLFNELSLEGWLQSIASKFSRLHFGIVADSASANVKLNWKLMAFLQKIGERYNIFTTSWYYPCCLHQLARILATRH